MDAPVQMFRSVISQPTIAQMFEFLTPVLSDILDYRDDLSNNQVTQEVENAKKYICQNYKDIGLSLDVVSKHVYISSCYLSVLFKKETGDSFINFLTNVRINKAKELLLSTNLKSYEISYQVGYENPTYFSTLFKKITGLTPMDYKKNLRS
jgi:two-component system response regulator YesN